MPEPSIAAVLGAAAAVLEKRDLRGLAARLERPGTAAQRYLHLVGALARLPAHGSAVAEFLCGDAVVLARMQAAAEVLREAGLQVDTSGGREDAVRRAVHWRRFSQGPAPGLHRACGQDIARGSLRIWSLAGGMPTPGAPVQGPSRTRTQLARVRLSAQIRTACAVLRADLAAEASGLSRRDVAAFDARVRREVHRVTGELERAVSDHLAGLGLSEGPAGWPVGDHLPPRRRPRLENRLTALLGTGFGAGVSMTLGRLVVEFRPEWPAWAAAGGVLPGLALTAWTVRARGLLAERIAAERWMLEATAGLRPALEERMVTRLLLAQSERRYPPDGQRCPVDDG